MCNTHLGAAFEVMGKGREGYRCRGLTRYMTGTQADVDFLQLKRLRSGLQQTRQETLLVVYDLPKVLGGYFQSYRKRNVALPGCELYDLISAVASTSEGAISRRLPMTRRISVNL